MKVSDVDTVMNVKQEFSKIPKQQDSFENGHELTCYEWVKFMPVEKNES